MISPRSTTFDNSSRWALVARSRDPEADLRARIAAGLAAGELGDPRFERREGPHGSYLMPPLVEIPGGEYPIGADEPFNWEVPGLSEVSTGHIPQHSVQITAFSIGQYPVTNGEWACFMAAEGYEDERWWDTEDGRRWRRGEMANEGAKANNRFWRARFLENPGLFEQMEEEGRFPSEEAVERWRDWMALDETAFESALDGQWRPQRHTEPAHWQDERLNHGAQPVVGISWYEARAYCRWLAAQTGLPVRLPKEVEWEAAAGGREGRRYAWGEEDDPTRSNTYETRIKRTTPVGGFFEGDTPEGVSDLSGNALEWTSSAWGAEDDAPEYGYPYVAGDGREDADLPPECQRVLRGGAWFGNQVFARAAFRSADHPLVRRRDLGFRVVAGCPHSVTLVSRRLPTMARSRASPVGPSRPRISAAQLKSHHGRSSWPRRGYLSSPP